MQQFDHCAKSFRSTILCLIKFYLFKELNKKLYYYQLHEITHLRNCGGRRNRKKHSPENRVDFIERFNKPVRAENRIQYFS